MTRTRTSLLIVALVAAAVALALLLRDGTAPASRPDETGELEVVLQPRSFEPDRLVLPSGEPLEVTFVNNGDVVHHLGFGREPIEENGEITGYAQDLFSGIELEVDPPQAKVGPSDDETHTTIRVPPDESVTMNFTLPAERQGEWQIGCFTAAGCYYEVGFHATVIVE